MKRLSNRNDATVQTGTASEAFINVQRRGLSAEMIMTINHYLLQVAQSELVIAQFLGDGALWQRAMAKMRVAMGTPRYKRGGCNGVG